MSTVLIVASVLNLSQVVSHDPLESARKASIGANGLLRSVQGTASFEVHVQDKGDEEPILRTKGKARIYFHQGKYHVRIAYEKQLTNTVTTFPDGTKERKQVDAKPNERIVVFDGQDSYVVTFSKRIRPVGCAGGIYHDLRTAFVTAGLRWSEPARLWKDVVDVNLLIKNLGASNIEFSAVDGGLFRGKYNVKNSQVQVEFDVDPNYGFNVVSSRVFNPNDPIPANSVKLNWRSSGNVWYVTEVERIQDYRRVKSNGTLTRSVIKYNSFEANVDVDPTYFTLESVEMPVGTRFLDRRPNAPNRNQWWGEAGLSVDRPKLR